MLDGGSLANHLEALGIPRRDQSVVIRHGASFRVRVKDMHASKPIPREWKGYPVEVQPWSKAIGMAR